MLKDYKDFIRKVVFVPLVILFLGLHHHHHYMDCSISKSRPGKPTNLRQKRHHQDPPILQYDSYHNYNYDNNNQDDTHDLYEYPFDRDYEIPTEKTDDASVHVTNHNIPEFREVRENSKSGKKVMCYKCTYKYSKNSLSSLGYKECDDPFEESEDTILFPCSGYCYKHYSQGPKDGAYTMTRDCSKACHENTENTEQTWCCNTDRCNSAVKLKTFTFNRFPLSISVCFFVSIFNILFTCM